MVTKMLRKFFSKTGAKQDTTLPVSLAQFYADHVPWELPVQYCASDCLKSGDTVLDIGGHVGGVAIALARLVGEAGRVYTFEPNREMWPHLLENLAINQAENVSHIPLACFSESGRIMTFYSEPSFYKAGSGLLHKFEGAKCFDVVTISVDDFCQRNNLKPAFMKIDVEGAEIHVLRSASKLLEALHLPIILEYQATANPNSDDPLMYLERNGYRFFDVNTYAEVSASEYATMPDLPLVNVFCVHKNSGIGDSYSKLKKTVVFESEKREGEVLSIGGIHLPAGRYVVGLDFDCPGGVVGGLGIKNSVGFLAYYEADSQHLRQHSCSSMVIKLKEPQTLSVEFIKKGDYVAGLRKVSIVRLEV